MSSATLLPIDWTGEKPPKFDPSRVPNHVGLVMDGNGRWANLRGLPRVEGHIAGEDALLDVVAGALQIGIPNLSVFAFSTENWNRSAEEVRFLMGFNRQVLRRRRDQLKSWGVKILWAGREPRLWKSVINELQQAERLTSRNHKMNLYMCVNYGGRAEIVEAVRKVARQVADGSIDPHRITEKSFAKNLNSPSMPSVDLFIRTSGEKRLSNFLLWQSAYAELIFLEDLWPDMTRAKFWNAVLDYQKRIRRFGSARDKPQTDRLSNS